MKSNKKETTSIDVFKSTLVANAYFSKDYLEMPVIYGGDYSVKKVIPFSKCMRSTDFDSWVHFYEDDYLFERIWNRPQKYINILKRYDGVISPDFSLYRDMPIPQQIWNSYRGKAIASWLQELGLKVILNVRWSDYRSFEFCCNGAPHNSTIAVGTHGCLKTNENYNAFSDGIQYVVNKLHPKQIIVYGKKPEAIFGEFEKKGIVVNQFESDFALSRKKS